MHPIRVLWILTVALLLLIGMVVLSADAVPAMTSDDPFVGMSRSGPAPTGSVMWLGILFGLCVLGVLGATTMIGLQRASRTLKRWTLGGFLAYGVVFLLLVRSGTSWAAGEESWFGGFPMPTAWLVYGIWLFPWIWLAVFALRFDDFYSDEDEAAFEALLQAGRGRE